MYFVYILHSELDPNRYYTGYTRNVDKRIIDHNSGKNRSTKSHRPWSDMVNSFFSLESTSDGGFIAAGRKGDHAYLVRFAPEVVGIGGSDRPTSSGYTLCQNYPNPFNPSTTISYDLPQQSEVILNVYDMRGREVRTLKKQEQHAGHFEVQWNGVDDSGNPVSTGLYFARLLTGDYSMTIKMVYLE